MTPTDFSNAFNPCAADVALQLVTAAPSGHYDELCVAGNQRQLRSHWAQFFEQLGADPATAFDQRLAALQRQIHDDGITYNVYSDLGSHGPTRPWSLDLLPFVISAAEWSQIEQGVAQRAQLTAEILRDIYGAQRLLQDGLLPPALVFGHPGYLRPMVGSKPVGGTHLHIAAFNLARAPDGRWWLVSQRTQTPSGLGYALQNRLIVSRQFPEAFHALGVQRLASSFKKLLDAVTRAAPQPDDGSAPRVVLLTPGPYNETYFEHAYLARYLGLPLVEGSDLTVREDRVFLKTVYGLERVHAILRRLADDLCDPLELRPDSTLGIPGLIQAVRAQQVLLANAPGSGFLESPAISGFLPAICERLFKQPLRLPSLASWWCGEQAAYRAVAAQLQHKVIKATYPRNALQSADAVIGADLSPQELDQWRQRIEADPAAFTVQDYLPLSQARVWQDSALLPRAAMVRVYAIADGQGRWHVMPGGLTRIAGHTQNIVSMQRGGSSLDTWVQTAGAVDSYSMLPQSVSIEDLVQPHRPVSSRAAENLFWMGRYAERADHTARLAQAVITLLSADQAPSPAIRAVLFHLCSEQGLIAAKQLVGKDNLPSFEQDLLLRLQDPAAESVAFNLAAMQRAGAQIRERLSAEHWRLLREALLHFGVEQASSVEPTQEAPSTPTYYSSTQALNALGRLSVDLAAITGAQADRMTRDNGWRLMTIGRQIERLACMATAVAAFEATGALHEEAGFDLLLNLADSAVTYRALYQNRKQLSALLHLLVQDSANPRALACVVELINMQLARLPSPPLELLTLLLPPERWLSLPELCEVAPTKRLPALAALLETLQQSACALSDVVSARYFSHAVGYQVIT